MTQKALAGSLARPGQVTRLATSMASGGSLAPRMILREACTTTLGMRDLEQEVRSADGDPFTKNECHRRLVSEGDEGSRLDLLEPPDPRGTLHRVQQVIVGDVLGYSSKVESGWLVLHDGHSEPMT